MMLKKQRKTSPATEAATATPATPSTPIPPGTVIIPMQDAAEESSEENVDIASKFTPETHFQVQLGVDAAEVDGATVVVDHLRNNYFRLNATGTIIWNEVQKNQTFKSIVSTVVASHEDVEDATQVESHVRAFLADMIGKSVITSSSNS